MHKNKMAHAPCNWPNIASIFRWKKKKEKRVKKHLLSRHRHHLRPAQNLWRQRHSHGRMLRNLQAQSQSC